MRGRNDEGTFSTRAICVVMIAAPPTTTRAKIPLNSAAK